MSVSKQYEFDLSRTENGQMFVQILLVDSDGTGKAAKNEAAHLQKILSGHQGVVSIELQTSGGTGNLSGGAIFGILFSVCFVGFVGFFVYKRRDRLMIRPQSHFENTNFSQN